MPKRTDIESILIIGAGPIVIGQACEFDYSGVQACRVLRQEGYRIILVNSNPATIMTDPELAHATYVEPLQWQVLAKIIAKEKPDVLLPTMGGQTALNCALDLDRQGVLSEYNVQLIGASKTAIDRAEDRELFRQTMHSIGLKTSDSAIAHSLEEALQVQSVLGFPAIIRPSFTLGGSGGGVAYNREEFEEICQRGLELSPTRELLIDRSLLGWKEFELEVVRDRKDNCIIICTIENLDPMGVHTGDSITVAPAQTLTDREFQVLRNAACEVLRAIGVETGGANVQFAVDPETGEVIVIEMNPRVSRSSALASKATGFPIAKVAAQLAVGYTLDELQNEMTAGQSPASFEPTIDYVVTKIPRFNFEKFPQADPVLTTQMKSVGEVMAIGRTFNESLQKALRGLETGICGLEPQIDVTFSGNDISERLQQSLSVPSPERIFYVADAFRFGWSVAQVYEITHIDPWFLQHILDLIQLEQLWSQQSLADCSQRQLLELKRQGFSDARLAEIFNCSEAEVRAHRQQLNVMPVYKRVDTCAAEFATETAYLYSCYDQFCESRPTTNQKIMVIGGGPNRIGQGIEFDYCCVHAAMAMREEGYETIMVNCNPETVSTDYDIADRLYFEAITLEDVLAVVAKEKPAGVIVQFGGQTPLKLAQQLYELKVPIIGTLPQDIDCAEDRARFKRLLSDLKLQQPANDTATTVDQGIQIADQIGYPLVVRPSYVLGGRAMEVVYNDDELRRYMTEAVHASPKNPILLDRFLNDATEIDVDAVSDGEQVVIGGILQHIEQAGVHSGDSACVLPPYSLPESVQQQLRIQTKAIAKALNVVGLLNIQFALKDQEIFVLEVNPRAARTIPFVSKCIGISLAKVAARCMVGIKLAEQGFTEERIPNFVSVKEAIFPFVKFPGVDPILGPEMKSTGEVMGIGKDFARAFLKASSAADEDLPHKGKVFISVKDSDKSQVAALASSLFELGFELLATSGTAAVLEQAKLPVERVKKVKEGRPHIVDRLKNSEIALIVNTTEGTQAIKDSFAIRRTALQQKVCYTTTLAGALAISLALQCPTSEQFMLKSLQELYC